MKAQVIRGRRNIVPAEIECPEPRPDECLVQVKAVGICGSDVWLYNLENVNGILGHEFSGVIVKMGSEAAEKSSLKVGDRVFGDPTPVCHDCEYCRRGWFNMCKKRSCVSAFQEYLTISYHNLYKLQDQLTFAEGAVVEPLACALNGVNTLDVQLGDTAVVVGSGSIGSLMLQLIKARGAGTIIMVGIWDWQLEFARSLGAQHIFNTQDTESPYYTEDLKASISDITNGELADRVIVATPAESAMNEAQYLVGVNGTLVYFANSGKNIIIPQGALETARTIRFAWLGANVFPQAEKIVNSGLIDLKKIITHRFRFEDAAEAMKLFSSSYPEKIKGVLLMEGTDE